MPATRSHYPFCRPHLFQPTLIETVLDQGRGDVMSGCAAASGGMGAGLCLDVHHDSPSPLAGEQLRRGGLRLLEGDSAGDGIEMVRVEIPGQALPCGAA